MLPRQSQITRNRVNQQQKITRGWVRTGEIMLHCRFNVLLANRRVNVYDAISSLLRHSRCETHGFIAALASRACLSACATRAALYRCVRTYRRARFLVYVQAARKRQLSSLGTTAVFLVAMYPRELFRYNRWSPPPAPLGTPPSAAARARHLLYRGDCRRIRI